MMSAISPRAQHKAFPIADIDAGMYSAKEPWLSPQNAFSDIRDGYTFRSRLFRRGGFDRFSQCGLIVFASTTEVDAGTHTVYTLTGSDRIVGESCRFTWNDPTNGTIEAMCPVDSFGFQTYQDVNAWGWSVVETGTGTQIGFVRQNDGGLFASNAHVYWPQHSDYTGADVALGAMAYEVDAGLPIVGLNSYRDTSGEEFLVAANTTRFFLYSVGDGWFKDSAGVDTFTGTESDLFWMWPAGDDLIVTNGVDAIKKYTGASDTLANMGTTIGGSSVSAAKMAVLFRNRVVYLNTVEGGTSHPLRARWSGAGAYESLDVADFADAPPEMGGAVTAEFIADRLLVGFENGWMELVFTGDSRELFRWEKTTYVHGAKARLGTIADGARVLALTESGIEALDPNEQYPADISIPDYVLNQLDTAKSDYTFGYRNSPGRQFWWSVVNSRATEDRPNEMLVAQYQEDNRLRWSAFDIGFNCFSDYRSQSTPSWDDIDTNWDDYNVNWDSSAGLAGFPVALCGHANGTIFKGGAFTDKLDDLPLVDPAPIPFSATTERLSPFPGFRSHLGWVDFYVEASSGAELEIQFRGNSEVAAYKTVMLPLAPTGVNEKIYRRVRVNKTASFHRMTIKAVGGGEFAIDAVIPWFRPAGRFRNFG